MPVVAGRLVHLKIRQSLMFGEDFTLIERNNPSKVLSRLSLSAIDSFKSTLI